MLKVIRFDIYAMRKILQVLLQVLWPAYMRQNNELSEYIVFKHWIIQKVFRINSHVPWPVHFTSRIISPENIQRGTRAPGGSAGCHIDGRNGIKIGKNVWIGPRVSLISMNHDTTNFRKYIKDEPIIIGDNCWLGAGSIILPGVSLMDHTIVAAGAVVSKSFNESDIVIAGVPAKIVRKLPPYGNN